MTAHTTQLPTTRGILWRFGIIGLFLYNRLKDTAYFQNRTAVFSFFCFSFLFVFSLLYIGIISFGWGSSIPIIWGILIIGSIGYGYWAARYFSSIR